MKRPLRQGDKKTVETTFSAQELAFFAAGEALEAEASIAAPEAAQPPSLLAASLATPPLVLRAALLGCAITLVVWA